jgi:glucose-6-phosphate isomerase
MLPDYWEKPLGNAVPSFALDLRWMGLDRDLPSHLSGPLARVWDDLAATERGAVVNIDEQRRVGHYWLRNPDLAPLDCADAIRASWTAISNLVNRFAERFKKVLVVGIGGSALGPQLVHEALSRPSDPRKLIFLDNTDPDGMSSALLAASPLSDTLVVVISKSGGTPETRNGMLVVKAAYADAGLDFSRHAIAITQTGSALDGYAHDWLARLPMWDWVGGRTSVTSVVGLLPAALQGLDIERLLAGAAAMDAATRVPNPADNPAALLALAWYQAGGGSGDKSMVVLPYKDRLALLSKYLQQLVMESLGKRLDRQGTLVHQGLTVFGNKGSTDQHAYVQQLRDGRSDFFATFIEVLEDGRPEALATTMEVEPGITSGDYLSGFLAGTRSALAEAGRSSITLTVPWVDEAVVGALIALFERTVSIYASLIDVNAYHQPGVEAGKKAASKLLELQRSLVAHLETGVEGTASELARSVNVDEREVFHILRHLAQNGRIGMRGEGLERVFFAIKNM